MADASDINPFQSTLPARGATQRRLFCLRHLIISIHAPRTGSDCLHSGRAPVLIYFNPRSPHGERRILRNKWRGKQGFQSTLPARGATRFRYFTVRVRQFQSTLPARGATCRRGVPCWVRNFNPRSPHGERRRGGRGSASTRRFQSTLPARGATARRQGQRIHKAISIHAPRTGSDVGMYAGRKDYIYFNPRSPHGERHPNNRRALHPCNFNPRSPHGERRVTPSVYPCPLYFNPRSPHGERRCRYHLVRYTDKFQSTLPARGATNVLHHIRTLDRDFNPRSPHGERHHFRRRKGESRRISIHAPRTGSDKAVACLSDTLANFNPRSPHGERRLL